jgi:hypothetical protein
VQVIVIDQVAHAPVEHLPVASVERAEPVLQTVGVGQGRCAVPAIAQPVPGHQSEPECGDTRVGGIDIGLVADSEDPADAG